MCLAILKPAKASISDDILRAGWIANPDGAGYAYVYKKKMVINKGFTTLKDFLASYKDASAVFKTSPFLIHFRIRSMGDKDMANTHPFPIMNNSAALIHNGTISGTGAKPSVGESDTALFVKRFGDDLDFDTITKNQKDWDDAVGYNKIAILYNDSRHAIINERSGFWNDDVWYSNQSYKTAMSSSGSSGRNSVPFDFDEEEEYYKQLEHMGYMTRGSD